MGERNGCRVQDAECRVQVIDKTLLLPLLHFSLSDNPELRSAVVCASLFGIV
jgi:hypothetical protein